MEPVLGFTMMQPDHTMQEPEGKRSEQTITREAAEEPGSSEHLVIQADGSIDNVCKMEVTNGLSRSA